VKYLAASAAGITKSPITGYYQQYRRQRRRPNSTIAQLAADYANKYAGGIDAIPSSCTRVSILTSEEQGQQCARRWPTTRLPTLGVSARSRPAPAR
jgi:hypothetical protein